MHSRILANWRAGLTVSLVSIPLSLALALASGATPAQGIITAFWAGLLGALLGGSHFNIIGPTGALSGLLVAYALGHGFVALPMVAVISGGLILLTYHFRLDRFIILIPRSVVHGFTLGVAFVIVFGQLDSALGLVEVPKTESLILNLWNSLQRLPALNWQAVAVFLFSAAFIYLWNKRFPRLPGAIIIAALSLALVALARQAGFPLALETLGDRYPDISGGLFEKTLFSTPWRALLDTDILIISGATALIAVLETLLSGQIADHLTKTKFDRPREVFALGIANLGSGLMGGIPATAALARTALNIKSGATDRTAGVISAIALGVISLFLITFFKLLPLAVIAAILTIVALGMVEAKHFIRLVENERTAFFLSLFVGVVVVVEDPISGILVGAFIALILFVNKVALGHTEVQLWKDGKLAEVLMREEFLARERVDADITVYEISGTLTYVNMPAHLKAAEKIRGNKYVIISMRHAFYADSDGIDYLTELIETLKRNNEHILISGINREIEEQVKKAEFYQRKLAERKIYHLSSEAVTDVIGR
ncbi:MAG TPA: SulP family inorganic anion transporter [candidate division Zixibacteria bacterium]|nr:SulP family inorganic anion transporter [candidate division Zixibacteria bacterium]